MELFVSKCQLMSVCVHAQLFQGGLKNKEAIYVTNVEFSGNWNFLMVVIRPKDGWQTVFLSAQESFLDCVRCWATDWWLKYRSKSSIYDVNPSKWSHKLLKRKLQVQVWHTHTDRGREQRNLTYYWCWLSGFVRIWTWGCNNVDGYTIVCIAKDCRGSGEAGNGNKLGDNARGMHYEFRRFDKKDYKAVRSYWLIEKGC